MIIERVLGTVFSDYDRRTGDTKTKPKTGAGSSHGHGKSPFMTILIDSRTRVNERLILINI